MPAPDWTRVPAGIFHDFHQSWVIRLRDSLNAGCLPDGYYALAEQRTGSREPDVVTLEAFEGPSDWKPEGNGSDVGTSVLTLTAKPPKVRFTVQSDEHHYATKADRVAIHHVSDDRLVAFIEVVSPGNKDCRHSTDQFLTKLLDAFDLGCHLMVLDLFPPGPCDPNGLHFEFWTAWCGERPDSVTNEQPLGMSAFRRDRSASTAYFEPIAVGQPIPEMPLFLTPEHYVNVPLQETYQATWRSVPQRWKRVIEVVTT